MFCQILTDYHFNNNNIDIFYNNKTHFFQVNIETARITDW